MADNIYRKCIKCGRSPNQVPDIKLSRFPKPGPRNAVRCESWSRYCFPNSPWASPKFQEELHHEHKMLCNEDQALALQEFMAPSTSQDNQATSEPGLSFCNVPKDVTNTDAQHHKDQALVQDLRSQPRPSLIIEDSMITQMQDHQILPCSYSPSSIRQKSDKVNEHRAKVMARGLPEKKPLPGVKSIILVASGKGGVGKTTTAVNLACAMKVIEPDKEIGLLDADVFGPSVPLMMNISGEPMLNDDNLIEPLLNYGVKCMSMGLLVSGENAVVWRGLMVMQALERLTRHVAWGPLDCLVVDTPPGTGDTHLSLAQNLPIDGALVVTTPQSAALQVTKRGVIMFEKLKVPIIGMVENMSHAICQQCGAKNHVFGNETGKTAQQMGLEIIESFEVDPNMSECINSGKPAIYALPDSIHAEKYRQLANKVFKYIEIKDNERAKAKE